MGLDMTCYNGSPDVDFAKASEAFGVEAEVVNEPSQIKAALAVLCAPMPRAGRICSTSTSRAKASAPASTWYPAFSVAGARTRNV